MAERKQSLSEQIRKAVDDSGMSRYRICKLLDISESNMSRFMAGAWLGRENIDALADLLGLEVTVKHSKKITRKSAKRKGR